MDKNECWKHFLEKASEEFDSSLFKTWIKPLKPLVISEDRVIIFVKDAIFMEFIESNHSDKIKNLLKNICGFPINLIFTDKEIVYEKKFDKKEKVNVNKGEINPDFTFDDFVVGGNNRFAYSASHAVAESPGNNKFNPLYLYGKSGLGKTHLLFAIGNYAVKNHSNLNIKYVSADKMQRDLIENIQKNKTAEFRESFNNLDILLVDDIHFLSGTSSTQEEFFHIFNTIYQRSKQIIITSDKQPRELSGIEDRLVSRFQWGLSVDIQPPDLETKIAILNKKAENHSFELSPDIIRYIASNTDNIRELEGCIIKLLAYSSINNRLEITLDLAKDVLKFGTGIARKKIYIEQITESVINYYKGYKIDINDVLFGGRKKEVALVRQVSMYLSRTMTSNSLKNIGSYFRKDHSTVVHSIKNINKLLKEDEQLGNDIENIKKNITENL